MINRNKKGFTIVELVIVIAVIAILAAVLIPTFAGIIKKANLSADQQAVRQMNTALAVYEAENGKPETIAEAKKALDEALVNVEGGLIPVTQGYAFYWDSTNNEVVLVGEDTTIESGWILLSNNGFGKKVEVATVDEIRTTIAASSNENPAIITLKSDVTSTMQMCANVGNAAIIDLNGKTLTFDTTKICLWAYGGGYLEIKNGTIVLPSTGTNTNSNPSIQNTNSTLILKNVTINSAAEKAVFVKGFSDTSIIDSTINCTGSWGISTNSTDPAADGARIVIENSKITAATQAYFCSINADLVASNSTFTTTKTSGSSAVLVKDGQHEFNNCKFVTPSGCESISLAHGGANYSGSIKAKFNGCEYYNGETKLDKATIVYSALAANATVTIDSDYTVTKGEAGSTGSLTINGTSITLE